MNSLGTKRKLIRFPRQRARSVFLGLLVALALGFSTLEAPAAAKQGRIVAVGDIHGAFDALVAILQQAKLINAQQRWIGGKATLVQTGDILDRGPKSRQVLDLLMNLEEQAEKKGGRVVILLGNHEMMNLAGDLRYVSPEEYGSYADAKSEERRKAAYQAHVEFRQKRAQDFREFASAPTPEAEWVAKHPPGFLEHREAFGPSGKYGRWLRRRPAVLVAGSAIFLHGGIHPALGAWTIDEINNRVRDEIRAFDAYKAYFVEQGIILPFFTLEETTLAVQGELEARKKELEQKTAEAARAGTSYEPSAQEKLHVKYLEDFLRYGGWLTFHPEGPLWFRELALWPEEVGLAHVAALLRNNGASTFVIGHTPQPGQINSRFGGRVFVIDTGMLSSYYQGGRASALEIEGGTFTAIYPTERAVLLRREAAASLAESKVALASPVPRYEPPSLAPPRGSARVWLGPDGQPLPFTSDEGILEFLRTARVVRVREIGQGITRPRQLLLEKDGIQMRAAFRDISEEKSVITFASGKTEIGFRDSYLFEPAAYELALLLGLDNVPPATVRRVEGKSGSVQIWVEKVMTEGSRKERKIVPPDPVRWNYQMYIMHVFDKLVQNTDRNLGNVLIDENWRVWMIDHTRAFRLSPELENPEALNYCERKLWERLQNLDEATVRQRLKPFLRDSEINAVLKRRQKLVEHFRQLLQERGEENVLYTLK